MRDSFFPAVRLKELLQAFILYSAQPCNVLAWGGQIENKDIWWNSAKQDCPVKSYCIWCNQNLRIKIGLLQFHMDDAAWSLVCIFGIWLVPNIWFN